MSTAVIKTTELSRIPKQARSRKKFQAILSEASRLIHEKGYEQVSMREIAREVGLPIASVYQYFPNKLAIVRQLWESYTSSLGDLLREEFTALADQPDEATLKRMISSIVDHMDSHHKNNPELLEVWRCVDGSPELRALNHEDTLAVARMVRSMILRTQPTADKETVMSRALIVCETASSTVKLAQELPADMQRGLLDNLKSVLNSMFGELT